MDGCLVFVPWPGMIMGERKIGYNRSCRIPDDTIDRLHCDRLIVLLLRGLLWGHLLRTIISANLGRPAKVVISLGGQRTWRMWSSSFL